MRILVSGASGLIGRSLVDSLASDGHVIGRLVRHRADLRKNEIYWDPERGSLDKVALENFSPEAVINLAGESIGTGRWTERKKQKIRDSRVKGSHILALTLANVESKPKVLIGASAIGYYGDRASENLNEDAPPGKNFLSELCSQWEEAYAPARKAGIRIVLVRTGIVLSKEGGALSRMLTPFRLGLGGVLGNGHQYFSWIDLDDVVAIYRFALNEESLQGPINAVSPESLTNREFTKKLGRALWRPTCFPLPASTARMLFGETKAEELLLASARVEPAKLKASGFQFSYPDLKSSLKHVLK